MIPYDTPSLNSSFASNRSLFFVVATTSNLPANEKQQEPASVIFSADVVTLFIALVAAAVTTGIRYKRDVKPVVTRRKFTNDLLNGSVIYPFLLLIASVGSVKVFSYIENSKLAVGLAGIVGVVFIVGELLLSCSPDDTSKD